MALREIPRLDFVRISGQTNLRLPMDAIEAAWFACDGDELVAVVLFHRATAEWQYVIYCPEESHQPEAVAAVGGFNSRADTEHALAGEMQELLLAAETDAEPCPESA